MNRPLSIAPYIYPLFRVVIGLLFTMHGAATVFGWFGGAQGKGVAVAMGTWPNWYAGVIELVCGVLVAIGLGTRWAAFLASGSMAYAYFVVHQGKGLTPLQNRGESAAMYCWAFFVIFALGPGRFALDNLIFGRSSRITGYTEGSQAVRHVEPTDAVIDGVPEPRPSAAAAGRSDIDLRDTSPRG